MAANRARIFSTSDCAACVLDVPPGPPGESALGFGAEGTATSCTAELGVADGAESVAGGAESVAGAAESVAGSAESAVGGAEAMALSIGFDCMPVGVLGSMTMAGDVSEAAETGIGDVGFLEVMPMAANRARIFSTSSLD